MKLDEGAVVANTTLVDKEEELPEGEEAVGENPQPQNDAPQVESQDSGEGQE
jgi:hypothetical protein